MEDLIEEIRKLRQDIRNLAAMDPYDDWDEWDDDWEDLTESAYTAPDREPVSDVITIGDHSFGLNSVLQSAVGRGARIVFTPTVRMGDVSDPSSGDPT
jgi:hypothetical protein